MAFAEIDQASSLRFVDGWIEKIIHGNSRKPARQREILPERKSTCRRVYVVVTYIEQVSSHLDG